MHDPLPLDAPPRDADMPEGMVARPGEGDVEEAFVDVMPDFDVEAVMPAPLDDGAMLDSLRADAAAMTRALDRQAVADQERADARAAAGLDRVADDAGSFETDFDVAVDPIDADLEI